MSEREVTEREVVAYFARQVADGMAGDESHGERSDDWLLLEGAGADDISPRLQREVLAEARRMLAAGSSPLAADDDGETVRRSRRPSVRPARATGTRAAARG